MKGLYLRGRYRIYVPRQTAPTHSYKNALVCQICYLIYDIKLPDGINFGAFSGN
jgi:hypothetical protein